jgi:DNA-binding winged helix-turn-helix (wHTH) protein
MTPRYRLEDFIVSPGRRTLLRAGREVPLIPRYLDLLLLLIEQRHRAVQRGEILDIVWRDVVVSDGALSQAVRTLRRALGDTAREPRFVRTVSRHGYRFVHEGVVEEREETPARPPAAETEVPRPADPIAPTPPTPPADGDPFAPALRLLLDDGPVAGARPTDEARLEAAESLHLLGTDGALARLDRRPGHERARAFLREARWDVAGAGPVPILGQPGWPRSFATLVSLRLRRAARIAGARLGGAAAGGAAAGALAGFAGGLLLQNGPGAGTPAGLPTTLALLGIAAGGIGAIGVGAGLAFAEAVARSMRGPALVVCGAVAGGAIGSALHLLIRGILTGMFGQDVPAIGGAIEGLAIGGAAGLGYALSTPRPHGGGMATPRGLARVGAALVAGVMCAVAGAAVCRLGGNLAGTSLNVLAHAYSGSRVGLQPLARMLGEADAGPLTRTVSGGLEGLFFGAGLVTGLTRRPR